MRHRMSTHPPGTITSEALFLVMGIALAAWSGLSPREGRAGIASRPVARVSQGVVGEDRPDNVVDWKARALARAITAPRFPTLTTPVADLEDTVRTLSESLFKGARAAKPRKIMDALGADRLNIAGVGVARLLGITVPPEQAGAALAYLREAVRGKRLVVAVATARDPEKRPLVLVALEDGTLVNARLIQQGLAEPWRIPGPWDEWGTK